VQHLTNSLRAVQAPEGAARGYQLGDGRAHWRPEEQQDCCTRCVRRTL